MDTNLMPWLLVSNSPKNDFISGSHAAFVSYKQLSKDVNTGSETLLIKYDQGYDFKKSAKTLDDVEIFVLDGSFMIGERLLGKYGYGYAPKGYSFSSLSSPSGCVLFVKSKSGSWFHA